jgi:hypothetical protein
MLAAQVPGAPKAPSLGVGLGLKVSTLGFGPEVSFSFAPKLGIRGGFQLASVSRDVNWSDVDYAASVKLQSVHALLDLFLVGPFRLSAGVVRNGNKFEVNADPTTSVQLGDSTYQASQVGTIGGRVDFRKAAGYFGLGIGGKGRVGFIMDFGVMLQGSPRVTYTGTTSLTGPAQTLFDQQVQMERADIQQTLDDTPVLKLWPVIGFGLQVKI